MRCEVELTMIGFETFALWDVGIEMVLGQSIPDLSIQSNVRFLIN